MMEGSMIYTLLEFANHDKPIIAEMTRITLGLIAPFITENPLDAQDWLEDPDLFLAWELGRWLRDEH